MISTMRASAVALVMLVVLGATRVQAQKGDYLSDAEQDKLRDTQDPSQRIKVYLDFAQSRLDRFAGIRGRSGNSEDVGDELNQLLNQYISITDEMKNWISDQYRRDGDMRKGLRALVEEGPKQLEELRRIQNPPDGDARDDEQSLRDAVADMNDAVDGGTKALSAQEKKFGELKQEEKAQAREIKERRKEEEKRNKEEKKLRERLRKKHKSENSDKN